MSTFKIEKNKNYTVISNYHLRDMNLSLKTKGLLTVMLSLPENWDYTEAGLCKITGEGKSAIKACLKQLEEFEYLERNQTCDERGRYSKSVYLIYEIPKNIMNAPMSDFRTSDNPSSEKPISGSQLSDNPTSENSMSEKPISDNQRQRKKEKLNNKIINNISINQSSTMDGMMDGNSNIISSATKYQHYQNIIKQNVNYDLFQYLRDKCETELENDILTIQEYENRIHDYDISLLDRIIQYMTDFVCQETTDDIVISGNHIPYSVVKSKLLKIEYAQMLSVIKAINNAKNITNPKSYIISVLYNI